MRNLRRNITDMANFKTPIGGMEGSILNPLSWVKGVLGVIFLAGIVIIGLAIVGFITRKTGVRETAMPGIVKRII